MLANGWHFFLRTRQPVGKNLLKGNKSIAYEQLIIRSSQPVRNRGSDVATT